MLELSKAKASISPYEGFKIKPLSEATANQIAAGEVVERPSSVLKELIENSLDAGSTQITVEIKNGGIDLIEVVDNGEGIRPEELPIALKRYATSKIRSAKDLDEVSSYGFRGEALPSIASVSQFTIQSCQDPNSAGAELQIHAGVQKSLKKWNGSRGTRIRIENLFYNVPARLKFLKKPQTEKSRVIQIVQSLSLLNPSVEFKLFSDDKLTFHARASKTQEDRIKEIYGFKQLKENEDYLLIKRSAYDLNLWIFLLRTPLKSKSTKNQQLFVNHRLIKDRMLHQAVVNGFRGFLMDHETPGYFLFLEVKKGGVDVNVHPQKAEVRFSNSGLVFSFITSAIRKQLETSFHSPHRATESVPSIEPSAFEFTHHQSPLGFSTEVQTRSHLEPLKNESSTWHTQSILQESTQNEETPSSYFKFLRPLGTLFNTYILCQDSEGMVVIDQHAAHERITFNQLKKKSQLEKVPTKRLLIPDVITMDPARFACLTDPDVLAAIASTGFELSEFGVNTLAIHEIPELLPEKNYGTLIDSLFREFPEEPHEFKENLEDKLDHFLATTACHSSIRAGQPLSMEQIQELLKGLDELGHSPNCPHGRPAVVKFSRYEIEKWFKRTV